MAHLQCYCGSGNTFENCCQPFINGVKKAPTPEALMRSRYTAYVVQAIPYLIATTYSSRQKEHSEAEIKDWSVSNTWLGLQIINAFETKVEFKASFKDQNGIEYIHHELSTFIFENGSWYYSDGAYFE
jgi:SEC-C motif-containing protein